MKQPNNAKPLAKPTRGRPSGEPTKQIRVYAADVPKLCRNGETQAEAVRRILTIANAIPEFDSMEYLLTLHGYGTSYEMRFPTIQAAFDWSEKSKFPIELGDLRCVEKPVKPAKPEKKRETK